MLQCSPVKSAIRIVLIFYFSVVSYAQDCYDYKNTKDSIKGKITVDNNLHSEFFASQEASYPWYILRNEDGTFESALGGEITEEDKTPIEHTSNCVSTHQGNHIMNFCDAAYESSALRLEIYGGLPAYSSSLMIRIKDSEFLCFFKAAYPAPVFNCEWNILSKRLILKSTEFNKGERIYAWISVTFEEIATYKGNKTSNTYKIEGYLKPVVN